MTSDLWKSGEISEKRREIRELIDHLAAEQANANGKTQKEEEQRKQDELRKQQEQKLEAKRMNPLGVMMGLTKSKMRAAPTRRVPNTVDNPEVID